MSEIEDIFTYLKDIFCFFFCDVWFYAPVPCLFSILFFLLFIHSSLLPKCYFSYTTDILSKAYHLFCFVHGCLSCRNISLYLLEFAFHFCTFYILCHIISKLLLLFFWNYTIHYFSIVFLFVCGYVCVMCDWMCGHICWGSYIIIFPL